MRKDREKQLAKTAAGELQMVSSCKRRRHTIRHWMRGSCLRRRLAQAKATLAPEMRLPFDAGIAPEVIYELGVLALVGGAVDSILTIAIIRLRDLVVASDETRREADCSLVERMRRVGELVEGYGDPTVTNAVEQACGHLDKALAERALLLESGIDPLDARGRQVNFSRFGFTGLGRAAGERQLSAGQIRELTALIWGWAIALDRAIDPLAPNPLD